MSRFLDVLQVTPLPDGLQWRLNAGLRYQSSALLDHILFVPRGFVTDFASIPRIAWAILPPWGRYGPAAIAHDFLYWVQEGTRDGADEVLREAMILLGVDKATVDQVYQAVRLFGQHAWEHNAALRAGGYTRISSGADVPPYAAVPS